MNENTGTFIEEVKKQTFGIYLMMYNISREDACTVIANYFGTGNTIKHKRSSKKWTCLDDKGRAWIVKKDDMIYAYDWEQTVLETPALNYDEIKDLLNIVKELKRAGARSDRNRYCALYCRIGADGHTPTSLRYLVNIMAWCEDLLISALKVPSYRLVNRCQKVDRVFLEKLNQRKPRTMAEFEDIWYEQSHDKRTDLYNRTQRKMLNLHETFTTGMIEFKLFQFGIPSNRSTGNINICQLKSYIQLSLALSQMAKMQNSTNLSPLQGENPKQKMMSLLYSLGFGGDEFKTARNVLTRWLQGDTADQNDCTV